MSVFKVTLNNTVQGLMDLDPSSATPGFRGNQMSPSKQRQVYVMGPKKINRLLKDGDTFTDCNYWKQFAYPQCSLERAIVTVLTDDGSVYSDIAAENTTGVGGNCSSLTTAFQTSTGIDASKGYFDFTSQGGPANFLQVQNTHGSYSLTGQLNGNANLVFTLTSGQTQIFNTGDLAITLLQLKSSSSGGTAVVLASVRSVSTS